MKRIATLLLIFVAALYILALQLTPIYPWAYWLEKFSEAALIGAIADWFAVVALFRHPMGLSIPHTAIIPKNQARIADTLGTFVHENFLTVELVSKKLTGVDLSEKVLTWTEQPGRIEKISKEAVKLFTRSLQGLSDERVIAATQNWLLNLLTQPQALAKGIQNLGQAILEAREFDLIFNRAVRQFSVLISEHSSYLRVHLRKDMPWYIPGFVHDKLYKTIVQRVDSFLQELISDPSHPARSDAKRYLAKLLEELQTNQSAQTKLANLCSLFINDPSITKFTREVWQRLMEILQSEAQNEHSKIQEAFCALLTELQTLLKDKPELRETLNSYFVEIACSIVSTNGELVANFISSTMKTWDGKTLSSKIEEQIGQDLQYVRVNGTIVGGFVGLVLAWIPTVLG